MLNRKNNMHFSLSETSDLAKNSESYKLVYTFKFAQADVCDFAELTGDNNPIHLDQTYAQGTIFKKPIVQGFLVGSIFSRIFGTEYPGIGTIYLSQSMQFLAPVFIDEFYMAHITVKEVNLRKHRAVILTEIFDSLGKKVLTGDAFIQHSIFQS
jgi:3-hydroxybutyryl-CoA dehydratase